MSKKQKVLLVILDGWGIGSDYKGNAITRTATPNFDKLWKKYPHAILAASGESVGLPDGQMGTSEVNHLTIGSGRVMFQELVKINKAIKDESFLENPAFIETFKHVKKHNSVLHVQGLVSDGGVHSHQDHLVALLRAAKKHGVKKVYIHVFTDGRDTLPSSAKKYVKWLREQINEIGIGKISSISGRYYAMDRDHNWDRIDQTFELLAGEAKQPKIFKTADEAIEDAYARDVTDEFIEPAYIEVEPGEVGAISSDDGIIFVNFRSDRARQITERLLKLKEDKNVDVTTMVEYKPDYEVRVAFPKTNLKNILTDVLEENKISQLRVTETEKFAHLTFFMNGKRENASEGEDRMMLDSYSNIKTHDERPEMRTPDICKQIIQDMSFSNHQVIITNLCNADMVGHTGNYKAIAKGIEVLDEALGELYKVAKKNDYAIIITADHGNAEETQDKETGERLTAHTTNPVPFILVGSKYEKLKREDGTLADVAPTILKMLSIKVPEEMTGKSLV
ncbi:MAG: 2,3-bisphosphoglycerate-independent phosphoglycerate mutase [Pseudomonadales bacterium]|jgi:2,3-bisphosphoglycerate-independent phosphoglycerate mutase|nr:2,3-bisphosphoglycerate-independent phosphoglycerate mutase [Pseudomonadales bacterium]